MHGHAVSTNVVHVMEGNHLRHNLPVLVYCCARGSTTCIFPGSTHRKKPKPGKSSLRITEDGGKISQISTGSTPSPGLLQ